MAVFLPWLVVVVRQPKRYPSLRPVFWLPRRDARRPVRNRWMLRYRATLPVLPGVADDADRGGLRAGRFPVDGGPASADTLL